MSLFNWRSNKPELDFNSLCAKALNDLKAKSSGHQAVWGLGTADRWDFDQSTGVLVFTFPDKIVSCAAQIVGSWNSENQTWLWAWSNSSVSDVLKSKSERVRAYGMEQGIEKLTSPKWQATESDAWQMSALTCLLNESQGVYRGPAGKLFVFIVFETPKIERR